MMTIVIDDDNVLTKFKETNIIQRIAYIYVIGHFSALLIFYDNKNEKANY